MSTQGIGGQKSQNLVNVVCGRPLILLRTGLLQTIFHRLSFVVAIASWFSLA